MWTGFELFDRVIIGGLLLVAGLAKLSATAQWRQAWLMSYRIVPAVLVRSTALAG